VQTVSQSATVGCTTSVVVEWRAVGDVTEDVHGAKPGVELEGFEVEEGAVDAVTKVVRNVMEGASMPAVKLDVPLIVDAGVGANWAEAH